MGMLAGETGDLNTPHWEGVCLLSGSSTWGPPRGPMKNYKEVGINRPFARDCGARGGRCRSRTRLVCARGDRFTGRMCAVFVSGRVAQCRPKWIDKVPATQHHEEHIAALSHCAAGLRHGAPPEAP